MGIILQRNESGATAHLSECGLYRYRLTRSWQIGTRGICNFIMLNPSTADALVDDPTIRRCIAYVREWGYRKLVVTNLFALRSTDPSVLKTHADPYGPENHRFVQSAAEKADLVVCAWGKTGALRIAAAADGVRALLRNREIAAHALKVLKGGEPGHPLYLRRDLEPTAYSLEP